MLKIHDWESTNCERLKMRSFSQIIPQTKLISKQDFNLVNPWDKNNNLIFLYLLTGV